MIDSWSRREFGFVSLALLGGCLGGEMPSTPKGIMQSFERVSLSGWGGPQLDAYFGRPAAWTPDWPVVIILHGAKRNLRYTMSTWLPLAQSLGFMPVIPHFTSQAFRGRQFSLGGVERGNLPTGSAFNAIEPLFDLLRRTTGARASSYSIFGHSAGAQFVQRFLLFKPEARARRTVASMAGWYTLPEERLTWPYGLANVSVDEVDFERMLLREGLLLLGEEDDNPRSDQLRRSRLAQSQGAHRLERGINYFSQCAEFARRNEIPMNWNMAILPDTTHSSRSAARACAAWLVHRD
ncbi:hypothetical protein [Aurantiacibacter hainanensis]|uniref:hypothetical protein n=1 Tax=Aurantiacibacter hainanensis TaxID=3076114 RepID=UPI0030C760A1